MNCVEQFDTFLPSDEKYLPRTQFWTKWIMSESWRSSNDGNDSFSVYFYFHMNDSRFCFDLVALLLSNAVSKVHDKWKWKQNVKKEKERNIDDDEGKQLKQDETCKILFCRVLICFAEILKFVLETTFLDLRNHVTLFYNTSNCRYFFGSVFWSFLF